MATAGSTTVDGAAAFQPIWIVDFLQCFEYDAAIAEVDAGAPSLYRTARA